MLNKTIYAEITNILNESLTHQQRIPKIKERDSFEIVGGKMLLIDIPKKSKFHYHSSSYVVECDKNNKTCKTDGLLIADLNTGLEIKTKLNELGCDVLAIHNYDSKSVKSTNVHFTCKEKTYDNTINIARFIGKY